jgi:quinolinate synthase
MTYYDKCQSSATRQEAGTVTNKAETTIQKLRQSYADDLCILAHHYQDDSVVQHADIVGDSLELARRISGLQARFIVLCGVFFMAESASILARESQAVYLPSLKAGCPLADMAPADRVERVVRELNAGWQKVAPLAYVNSSAAVKAVCGKYDGTVCTSANAAEMLKWTLQRADAVLFLPDRNLGLNCADRLGLAEADRRLLDPQGSIMPESDCALYVWPGYCHVHQNIRPEHVRAARSSRPEASVIVHPECSPEVVALADASGSTSQIIGYVEEAPERSCIFIGTEGHLVRRLAWQYRGAKEIVSLCQAECPDMSAVTEENLAQLLESLPDQAPVAVDSQTRDLARTALDRMLQAMGG